MATRSCLLFDLGGVLIENTTFEGLAALLPAPLPMSVLQERWLDSEPVHQFERGEIAPEEFAQRFVAEWGLDLSPGDFLQRFAVWPRGPYPGALDLLTRLKPHYRIAILSNCNVIHWPRLAETVALADLAFSSHLCGATKPDAAIFAHVVREIGEPADRICFFDDSQRNVDSARHAGMEAHRVEGFGALDETVRRLGLLPEDT